MLSRKTKLILAAVLMTVSPVFAEDYWVSTLNTQDAFAGLFNSWFTMAINHNGFYAISRYEGLYDISSSLDIKPISGLSSGYQDGGINSATFSSPQGLALDSSGNLYLADSGNNAIRKVSLAGQVSTIAGNGSAGYDDNTNGTNATFNYPTAVAVGPSGNLYVADAGNNVIRKIDRSSNVSTLPGSFNYPSGVAVDNAGNVYVADSGHNVIQKISTNGGVSIYSGAQDYGSGFADGRRAQFSNPTGLAIDSSGNLYVSDTGNWAIRKIDTKGNVTTLAGGLDPNTYGWYVDGLDTIATFVEPRAITVDALGTVFVADSSGSIRTIAPVNSWGVLRDDSGVTITGYNGLLSNTVTVPAQINGLPVTGIANNAFLDNTNITSISIPNGITTIGSSAFSGCTSLKSATIPDSVVNMGMNIFYGAYNLTDFHASVNLQDFLSQYASELGISPMAVNSFTSSTQASLFSSIGATLANNTGFLAALTGQILATSGNYGLATKTDLAALAGDTNFVASLARNTAFLNALAAQLTSSQVDYGIASKDSQTLSFAPVTVTYSKKTKTVSLAAKSSAKLTPIQYTIGDGSSPLGSISGSVLTLTGVKGTTTITASQSGTAYVRSASVTVNLTVK